MSGTDPIPAQLAPGGLAPSLIRTCVPVAVGTALAWAAVRWNIVVDPNASAGIGTLTAALCIAGYYAAGRLIERRWPRTGGALISLGLTKTKPVYVDPVDPSGDAHDPYQ